MRELETSERLLLNALQLPPLQIQPALPSLPQFLAGADSSSRERPLPLEPPNSNPQRANSFPSAFQRHSSPPASGGGGNVVAPSGLANELPGLNNELPGLKNELPALSKLQGPPSPTTWLLNMPADMGKKELGEERYYPPLLPSLDEVRTGALDKGKASVKEEGEKKKRVRVKWTDMETADLFHGVKKHGVGNWMKILKDPSFRFNNRSSVDLKDRFRTLFPQQYTEAKSAKVTASATMPVSMSINSIDSITNNYSDHLGTDTPSSPPIKTIRSRQRPHSHVQVLSKLGLPLESSFPKAKRRQRLPFTVEEDERLMKGYLTHGATWTKIHSDPAFDLGHRRSTDLRDRFRTRYPEKYAEAGFKSRPKVKPPPRRSGPANGPESEGSDSSVGNGGGNSGGIPDSMGGQSFNPISGLTLPHPSQQHQTPLPPPLQHNDPLPASLEDIMNSTTTLNDSPPASSSTKDSDLSFLIHATPSIFDLPSISLPPLPSSTSHNNPSLLPTSSGPPNSDTTMPSLFPMHPDNFSSSLLDFEFASSATSSASNEEEERALGKSLGWEDLATRPIFDLGGEVEGMREDELGRKRMRVR